ncbi:U1 snRNP protein [Polyrhizophydium stewartii]|uniref:U1 snRNP protein n=1 Tax=Polyrhizophydium stewartii TaxID=2732419 RepID=A0ABR4NG89_9FUNG|nr:hypothetical protein HK105_003453 [Polyrhizophydium stewartii]
MLADAAVITLNAASTVVGPLGVVLELTRVVVDAAEQVKTNRSASKALAAHAREVGRVLQGQLERGYNDDILRNITILQGVLEEIESLFKKISDRNYLLLLLKSSKYSARIKELDARLSQCQQALGLAINLQIISDVQTIKADAAEIPALIEEFVHHSSTKFEVVSERLETLEAIKTYSRDLLNVAPPGRRETLQNVLDAQAFDIETFTGRGLSGYFNWSVDPDDVDIFWRKKIGAGGFGEVYEGKWDGKRVAVKVLAGNAKGEEAVRAIEKEASVWYPLNHANVLHLWRVCLNADHPFIVMELMKQDLSVYLRERPSTSVKVRMGLILSIARGMQYLHKCTPPIIHGDLKATNVLIGDDGVVRITDFGMAFIKANSRANTQRRAAALRWVAPEKYKRGYKLAIPSDIFSFAMTAVEILTGKYPFPELERDEQVRAVIMKGQRPPRPDNTPDGLWELIQDCWNQDPDKRPSFVQIVRTLESLGIEECAAAAIAA